MKQSRKKTRGLVLLALASHALLAWPHHLNAQEPSEDNGFLGTIELGTSKRAVDTFTATSSTVIDQGELLDRQPNTIAEIIDSVPGVSLINGSTPGGSGINIRGFGANSTYGTDQKILITVDGATTGAEELYRMGTQLFTDPSLYKSVRVSRGTTGSFEYGSGVVGGIVQLETKDAADLTGGKEGTAVAVTAGAYTNKSGLMHSTTIGSVFGNGSELLVNYSMRKQGNQKDGDNAVIENGKFKLPSYLVKYRHTNDLHSAKVSYTKTTQSEKDVPYDQFNTTAGSFGNVDRDTDSRTLSAEVNYNPADNDLVNTTIQLSQAVLDIDQFQAGGAATQNADHKYETTKLLVKNASYIETGSVAHDMRYGIEFINKKRDTANSAPGGTDSRTALFLVDDISVGDNLLVTPAIRHERQTIKGKGSYESCLYYPPYTCTTYSFDGMTYKKNATMGGLSAMYDLGNGVSPFASVSKTVSLPIMDDLPTTSDEKIKKAEKSRTTEWGVSYDNPTAFDGSANVAAKLTFYESKLTNNTTLTSGYSTYDKVKTSGQELEASLGLADGWYSDLNANFQSGTATLPSGVEEDFAQIPNNTYRATVGKRYGTALDVSVEAVKANSRSHGSDMNKGYQLYNVRATYLPFDNANTQVRLGIENVTDEKYQPALATRNAPGRNFKLTISHQF